tara:strand:+ start:101 stop:496 length:396 start_codon:yes stop_codon:yes gene_type:complete
VNICVQLGIIIFILLTGLNAGNEDPLYKSLETSLAKYRQSIARDDVTMQNGIFRLEMNGRRTNIKSQLLIGFYSIGRVLQKSSTPFREVQIIIYYDLKERKEVLAKAPTEKVMDLSQGRLSSEKFFVIIGY